MRASFESCFRLGSLTKASPGIVCTAIATLAGCSSALAAASGPTTTTIYVGRHFEVRDHDQPTKYVFNGATRVASITGSLSTNTRIQRLRLYPGWNLCSLAVTASDALQQLNSLSASGGEGQGEVVLSAFKWNLPAQGWLPVATNDNLAAGTVLWLKAQTNTTVAVIGAYADPTTQQVQSGGAYVPGTGLEAWAPNFPPTLSAWFFEPDNNQWHQRLAGDLAFMSNLPPTLSPGQALYVQTASPVSLEVPDPTLRIRYYHQDHLGSSSVITDSTGGLVDEVAYYPFGMPRNEYRLRQIEEHYTFTQKERDQESRLSYFDSRFLACNLARFIRVDPLAAEPPPSWLESPQSLNAYGYVVNNPLKFSDPSGQDRERANPQETKPKILVMYGGTQFTDFAEHTHHNSRAEFENALKAAYREEGGQNAEYVAVDISKMTQDQFKKFFKGSSYDVVVYDGHGSGRQKIILPEGRLGSLKPEDLEEAFSGAKSAPKKLFFYGCNTAASGFARALSEGLPETEITGSGNRIAPYYTYGKHPTITEDRDHNITFKGGEEIRDVRKIDVNSATIPR